MFRAVTCLGFVILLTTFAFGQASDSLPKFEAADVRVSPPSSTPVTGGLLRGTRFDMRNATMIDLVKNAYGLDIDERVFGGPTWLGATHFDIVAKAPAGTPKETVRKMMQQLLTDRFKLVVHNDNKPISAYALTVGKGKAKMKESDGQGVSTCDGVPQNPEPGAIGYNVVACKNMTMAELAEQLPQLAPAYIVNAVVDQTELKGTWDFELKWTAKGQLVAAGSDGITMMDAVEKQLGLKLELKKIPMSVVVVDRVNEKPTDNLPGVTTSLAAPTEFEVAVVKPSAPETTQMRGGFQPGGRIDVQGTTLKNLMTLAWDITPDMLVDAPKWMETDRWDIIAKAPAEMASASVDSTNGPPMDIEALRGMVRALVTDRFKLKLHKEEQQVNVYALSAPPKGETKLKKADPSSRSECKRVPGPANNPALTQSYGCQNTTMAQFAQQVRGWAPAYMDRPVVDLTGLEGGWDFVVSWSPKGLIDAARAGGDAGASGDPSGGLTMFESVDRLLGLKLTAQKHSMPVLVIDHVEKATN